MSAPANNIISSAHEGPNLQRDDQLACETCGVAGAFAIGNRSLCESCYQECGACCQGSADEGDGC